MLNYIKSKKSKEIFAIRMIGSRRSLLLIKIGSILLLLSLLLVQQQRAQYGMSYNHHFLVACGYAESATTPKSILDDRFWSSDDPAYKDIHEDNWGTSTSTYDDIPNSATAVDISVSEIPFRTARVSRTNFTYTFVLTESEPIFIRLYFYSTTYNSDSTIISPDRFFFSVVSNTGVVLLNNFTASSTHDLRREFFLTTNTDGFLELTFAPCLPSYYAFVNGIEVVSASPNLLYRHSDSDNDPPTPSSVPANSFQLKNFQIGDWSSLETMYRVNVGGPEIKPTEDSTRYSFEKMYRHWDDDEGYEVVEQGNPPGQTVDGMLLITKLALERQHSIPELFYPSAGVPGYVASHQVYLTGKKMGTEYFLEASKREKSNLKWRFEVDVGFYYLVRLHWCEFDETVNTTGDRVFDVYINNQIAEENVDLMGTGWGNGSKWIPIYRDYVVYQQRHDIVGSSSSTGRRTDYLRVALRPVPTGLVDVMLNGIEIFKANRSDRSLANPNANPLPPQLSEYNIECFGLIAASVI